MQVSVETLNGLERKVTISIPAEEVQKEIKQRLQAFKHKLKVPGFRPGKVPESLIKSRYLDNLHYEVSQELIKSTYPDALRESQLKPAGYPSIEPKALEENKEFVYTIAFEIYPEIKINEPEGVEVELIKADVSDSDRDALIDKLRAQNKIWQAVTRPIAEGDKVIMDFVGKINKEAFEGGAAQRYELIIGSNLMIPGFEKALIGGKIGEPFDIKVTFPKDYQNEGLAGKKATFTITVHEIQEGTLPGLDDEFAAQFDVKEGGVEAFKKDIEQTMKRELEDRVSQLNRERIFSKFLEKNPFDVPASLVDNEIDRLNHEMYHRISGKEHHENEKIPRFPRELFEQQALHNVRLGLLLAEYVNHHQFVPDEERIKAKIEKVLTAYQDPESMRRWYKKGEAGYTNIEATVIQDMIAQKLLEKVKQVKKKMTYEEIMNPKQPMAEKGDAK